jgi:hypothetical protein
METKRLTTQFSYRIEPKPEGGFIARSTDPAVPSLEAPTREELLQKIEASTGVALAAAFPGLKLPTGSDQLKFDVRTERSAVSFSVRKHAEANFEDVGNAIANAPITPETSGSSAVFGFLALLIIGALVYYFLHRH